MHAELVRELHSRRLWLSVVSAVLLVLGRGFGLITAADSAAVYGAAGIVVSLVLGDSYVASKHVAATTTDAVAVSKQVVQ